MTEESSKSHNGVACIKPEYILENHSRELNVNFVSAEDKKNIDCDGSRDIGPPKKKLKGQNKHRPHNKKIPNSEKLCFSFSSSGTCSFGERCTYSHNLASYMECKPTDIKESCYLYETYGKCPYSLSCRFGSKHIIENKNVVDQELFEKSKDKDFILNTFSKDLQFALRRRKYDFSKSLALLKEINVRDSMSKCDSKSTGENINLQDARTCSSENKDLKNSISSDVDEAKTGMKMETSKSIVIESKDTGSSSSLSNSCRIDTSKPTDSVNKHSNVCDGTAEVMKDIESSKISSALISDLAIDKDEIRLRPSEIKKIDFKDKLYLAPLTTVGNLPFRRICKEYGADITCGEMAMATCLLQGSPSEWALLKRHHTEDIFGVQLCGGYADAMTKCCQILNENISVDFIDLNMGCPLDIVYQKGAGCGLMNRIKKLEEVIHGMSSVMDVPLTIKMRTGVGAEPTAHQIIKRLLKWKDNIQLITIHGRSRLQRYTKSADWQYIDECSKLAQPIPVFGGGDVLSYEEYNFRRKETSVSGIMIARGALIKPWIFKEIKDQNHWDISSGERFDILKSFVNYGLEHWGSDTEGVEKTRRFLLEWLSFLYRYIPVGLMEHLPQRINERPPPYYGRNDMETLMASPYCADWIKISEMFLGPVPDNFSFLPKHKANAYQ